MAALSDYIENELIDHIRRAFVINAPWKKDEEKE